MILFFAGASATWLLISIAQSDWWGITTFGILVAGLFYIEHWDRHSHPTKWRER